MTIPGFTAGFVLHGPSVLRRRTAGIARWTGSAHIQPARRTQLLSIRRVRSTCQGGTFWGPGPTTSTWGCMRADGTGIVCGGQTQSEKSSCDTF